MNNSNYEPIVIWASGVHIDAVNAAIDTYQREGMGSATFQVYVVEPHEYEYLINGGIVPNILIIDDLNLQALVEEFPSLFVSVNDIDESLFVPFASSNVTKNNNIYGVPYYSGGVALYYRKDIMDELGIVMHDNLTWEELCEIGQQLRSYNNMYLFPPLKNYEAQILMQSAGKCFYDEGNNISDSGVSEVLQLISQFSENDLIYPEYDLDQGVVNNILVLDDQIAATFGDSRFLSRILLDSNKEWGVIKLPKSGIFTNEVSYKGYSCMVLNDPEKVADCVEFLACTFGSNQDLAKVLAQNFSIVPVLNSAISDMDNLNPIPYLGSRNVIKFLAELGEEIPLLTYGKYSNNLSDLLNDIAIKVQKGEVDYMVGTEEFLSRWQIIKDLVRLEITKAPDKMSYLEGDKFNKSGLELSAVYSDGTVKRITDFTCSPEILTLENNRIAVKCLAGTCYINVNVVPALDYLRRNKTSTEYGNNPKVNLATGRLQYVMPDLSIGANSYKIDIAHVYMGASISKGMGTGWKLNVHQYLSTNSNGKINYVDANGYVTDFILFDEGNQRYNDESGKGLILYKETNGYTIKDDYGNLLKFNSVGNICETVSAINSSIKKVFEYDSSNRLIKVYDNRKPSTYVSFVYEDEFLSKIKAVDNNTVAKTIEYVYEQDALVGVSVKAGTESKKIAKFIYDNYRKLQYIIDCESKQAVKIIYDIHLRAEILSSGIVGEQLTFESFTEKDFVSFTYQNNTSCHINSCETVVTNKKGISQVAFVNTQGELVSTFEKSGANLKTLNRESKKRISVNGNTATYINGYSCANITSGQFEVPVLADFSLARSRTEKINKYYNCSFWLKHNVAVERLQISYSYDRKLNGDSKGTKTGKQFVDGYAQGVWQKVTLPLEMPDAEKNNEITLSSMQITLMNMDGTKVGFTISHLMFAAAPNTLMALTDGTTKLPFIIADTAKIYSIDKTYEIDLTSSTDIYFTEQDLLRTQTNRFANTYEIAGEKYFDVLCNNGKKRIANVSELEISYSTMVWSAKDNEEPFCSYTVGSDNKSTTEQFYRYSSNGITMETKVTTYPDGLSGESETFSSISTVYNYKGQKVYEKDEYELETTYEYDDCGNLTTKTLTGHDGKKMVFTNAYDENKEYLSSSNDGITTDSFGYIKPFGLLETVTNNGLTNKTHYNSFNDQVDKVSLFETNKESSGISNEVTYQNGLITTVSDGTVKYGIDHDLINDKTTYSQFDSCVATTKSTIQTERLIKNEDKTETAEVKYHRGEEIDTISTTADKYGRVTKVCENGVEKVSCSYIVGEESQVALPVYSKIDRYENTQTVYKYDPNGKLVQWTKGSIEDANTASVNQLTVQQIFAGDTKYTIGDNEKFYTHVVYDSTKNIAPQITATSASYDPNGDTDDDEKEIKISKITYQYDSLGRLKQKRNGTSEYDNTTYDYEYRYNGTNTPQLKKQTYSTVEQNADTYRNNIVHEYFYNDAGNIKDIIETKTSEYINHTGNYTKTTNYGYDKFNRLTSEKVTRDNNVEMDRGYSYFSSGKGKGKLSGIVDNLDETKSKWFIYNDKGQLFSTLKYNESDDITYSYDNFGNRTTKTEKGTTTSYKFTRGNILIEAGAAKYSYNADGVRFKKIANGITTTYYVDGGKILGEDRSDGKKLRYFYDKDGILGFRYYNGSYWADNSYVKDGQGNVIGILSNYRYLRTYYEYDAFGATTKVWGEGMDTSAESFIGSINPFRWKGHYYDVETGLYFIEGRFYDPETGTYLNAADAEQIEENAFSPLGLDRNGILCNNILNLIADIYTIFTVLEMNPDPDYDPDANKPWWELTWNAVTKWLAEKISGLMEWYNGIPWGWKVGIGVAAFIIAVVLTLLSHSSLIPIFLTFGTSVGISVFSSVDAARSNGTDMLEGAFEGLAEGVLWGGIFAAVGAVGNIATQCFDDWRFWRKVKKLAKAGEYDELAKMFTHNHYCRKVMIGKWVDGGPTSYVARAGKDYTYFSMPGKIWNRLSKIRKVDMWKINEAFLRQQVALGKSFFSSHPMINMSPSFKAEVDFLNSLGIKIEVV